MLAMSSVSAQVADTVTLFGDTKIRVLVSGDTVSMSKRQFENVTGLVRSFDMGLDICHKQTDKLFIALSAADTIEVKLRAISEIYQAQVGVYQREYKLLSEIAASQAKMIEDLNNRRFRSERRSVWRGVGYGVGGGALVGLIVGAIILR